MDLRDKNSFIPAVVASEFDNNDEPIFPDRFEINYVWTAGLMVSAWFTDYKNTWTKTYTYTSGALTKTSRWIKT